MSQHAAITWPRPARVTQHAAITWPPPDVHRATDFAGAGRSGLVPDPSSETGKFLRDDGTWAAP